MKLVTGYNTITIVSSITRDELRKAQRFCPEALTLVKDKIPVFKVTEGWESSIDTLGIIFAEATNSGECFATMGMPTMPQEPEKLKETIRDEFGLTLVNLRKVEDQVHSALEQLSDTLDTIDESIEITQ